MNYRSESLAARLRELTQNRGADVIVDPIGGDIFTQSIKAIAPEGRIVVLGFAAGAFATAPTNLLLVKEATVISAVYGGHIHREPDKLRSELAPLLQAQADGILRPHVHAVYDFVDIRSAMDEVASRRVVGKVAMVSPLGRASMTG